MWNSLESNYIAWHLPSARWAKKSAHGNLDSPDGYATQRFHTRGRRAGGRANGDALPARAVLDPPFSKNKRPP
jgi:hypothetical protein